MLFPEFLDQAEYLLYLCPNLLKHRAEVVLDPPGNHEERGPCERYAGVLYGQEYDGTTELYHR
jgi:hypothetical protein